MKWRYLPMQQTLAEKIMVYPREADMTVSILRAIGHLLIRLWLKIYFRLTVSGQEHLPKEGTLRLYHGNRWEHPANTEASNGGLTEHSYYSETKFQDIVDHKLELIGICVKELSDAMCRQFAEMIYSTVNDACEQTGNVVDAKGMPLADAFISTIEKISFSTDKNGAVLFPEVHAHILRFQKVFLLKQRAVFQGSLSLTFYLPRHLLSKANTSRL